MQIAWKVFAGLAGLLHVWIFVMEAVLWMNPNIHGRFRVETLERAESLRLIMFNQGFYNLFLAVAALGGLALVGRWRENVGLTLSLYACGSMLAAALALVAGAPELMRGAAIQGLFPALALIAFGLSRR